MIALIGGLRGSLVALAASAATFGLMSAYDAVFDDPFVAHKARTGFVALSEKNALEAQLAETKRQIIAIQQANTEFNRRQTARDTIIKNHEEDIVKYEKKLFIARRMCLLNGDDIEFLRKP